MSEDDYSSTQSESEPDSPALSSSPPLASKSATITVGSFFSKKSPRCGLADIGSNQQKALVSASRKG